MKKSDKIKRTRVFIRMRLFKPAHRPLDGDRIEFGAELLATRKRRKHPGAVSLSLPLLRLSFSFSFFSLYLPRRNSHGASSQSGWNVVCGANEFHAPPSSSLQWSTSCKIRAGLNFTSRRGRARAGDGTTLRRSGVAHPRGWPRSRGREIKSPDSVLYSIFAP